MQRHARTKFRKKGGAPFIGVMSKKLHGRAHEKLGLDGGSKDSEESNEDKTKDKEVSTTVEQKESPGKAPVDKSKED